MSKKIKQGLAKIADDQARDWPGIRKLQSMNLPEVEELKAFLDYKVAEFELKREVALSHLNAPIVANLDGAESALLLVRIGLFGEPMSEERRVMMREMVKEGSKP